LFTILDQGTAFTGPIGS